MMGYPISVKKNNYLEKRKNNCIETPLWLAAKIKKIITDAGVYYGNVYDIGAGRGNLSFYFDDAIAIDKSFTETMIKRPKQKIEIDFLGKNIYDKIFPEMNDLILSNPPFNDDTGKFKRKLLPELFLQRVFDIWGETAKIVLFAPMGMIYNQRIKSTRWQWLSNSNAKITSRMPLTIDTWNTEQEFKRYRELCSTVNKKKGLSATEKKLERDKIKEHIGIVEFHSEVIFFNMPELEPHYWIGK